MVPHIGDIWCPFGARMIPNGATNVSETRGKGYLDKIRWETMQYQIRTRLAVFYTHLASRAKRDFHDFCSKYQFLAHTKTWWEIFVIIHNKNRNSWKNCAHFGTHLGSKCTPAAWENPFWSYLGATLTSKALRLCSRMPKRCHRIKKRSQMTPKRCQ